MIAYLMKPLAGPIATGLAVIFLALSVGQCTRALKAERELVNAEAALVNARQDLATCRTNTTTLKASLDRQSEAVAALATDSLARQRESDKAVSAARAVAESHRRAADAILTAKPKGPDLCAEADRLILEAVR